MSKKNKRSAWSVAQDILDKNGEKKGKALIVLGIFMMLVGSSFWLFQLAKTMASAQAETGQIFITLGSIAFLLGVIIYVLKD